MLRTRHRQEAGREIDVFPAELELLGLPQAGVDGDGGHRPLFFADGVAECSLLVVGEEPDRWLFSLKSLTALTGFTSALPSPMATVRTKRLDVRVVVRRCTRCACTRRARFIAPKQ